MAFFSGCQKQAWSLHCLYFAATGALGAGKDAVGTRVVTAESIKVLATLLNVDLGALKMLMKLTRNKFIGQGLEKER